MKEVSIYFNYYSGVRVILGDHPMRSTYKGRFTAKNINVNTATFFKLVYPRVRLFENGKLYSGDDPRNSIHF